MQTNDKAIYKALDKVDISEALKLRFENRLTYQQIADKFGVSKQTIHQRLSRFTRLIENAEDVQAYEIHKAKLLTAAEMTMVSACLDPDVIAKASLNNRGYVARQIFEMNRLEQGKSTENVSVKSIVSSLDKDRADLMKRKEALLAQVDE